MEQTIDELSRWVVTHFWVAELFCCFVGSPFQFEEEFFKIFTFLEKSWDLWLEMEFLYCHWRGVTETVIPFTTKPSSLSCSGVQQLSQYDI